MFVTEREERERLEQEQREEEEREYQERLRKLEEQERKQRARQQEIEERERRREEERKGPAEEKAKPVSLRPECAGVESQLMFHTSMKYVWESQLIHTVYLFLRIIIISCCIE